MKRFLKTVGLMLVCTSLMVPAVDARGRNDRGQSSPQRTNSPASRPGNSGQTQRPSSTPTQRPGNSGASHTSTQRPGNNGSSQGIRPTRPVGNNNQGIKPVQRPGANGGMTLQRPTSGSSSQRPGNMGQGNQRPGNMGQGSSRPGQTGSSINRPSHGNNHNQKPSGGNDYRPGASSGFAPGHNGNNHGGNSFGPGPGGHDHRPSGPLPGHNPGYRPPHAHHHNFYGPGPVRPYMPPRFAWHRPTPPSYWRPAPSWRPFRSILGITLGTTLNLTLNALINSGYTITSYGTNSIYVQNVPMLNMMWPDAELFYNNAGGLCGSEFIFSTSYYDTARYDMTYNMLVGTYGSPISINNSVSGIEAMWWGTGNQFIRLAYKSDYAQNGSIRYFTTLSFGN